MASRTVRVPPRSKLHHDHDQERNEALDLHAKNGFSVRRRVEKSLATVQVLSLDWLWGFVAVDAVIGSTTSDPHILVDVLWGKDGVVARFVYRFRRFCYVGVLAHVA